MQKWVVNEETNKLRTSVKQFTRIDGNTVSYSMNGNKAIVGIQIEPDVDLVLKNYKVRIVGQPYDEVLLTTGR